VVGEPVLGAHFAELVVDADAGEFAHGTGFGEGLGYGRPEGAALLVVLAGDELAGFFGPLQDEFLVQGFEGQGVYDRDLLAFCGEEVGGLEGFPDHEGAERDDDGIGALAQNLGLAKLEALAFLVLGRSGLALQADVDTAFVRGCFFNEMTRPGMARIRARSSNGMWVPPLNAAQTPGSVPTSLTLSWA